MRFTRTTTTIFEADWIRRDFCPMTPTFRSIRAKARNTMTSCFKCHHKFVDDEMMALACFKKKGNRVLCQACADAMLAARSVALEPLPAGEGEP